MKNVIKILFASVMVIFGVQSNAQELDIYITFQTWKYSDQSRTLITTLTTDDDDDDVPVQDIFVNYFTVSDTGKILIDRVRSDKDGIASLILPQGIYINKDEEGYMHFLASVDEDEKYFGAEEELAVKDVIIDFTFELVDSVQSIAFKGIIIGKDGEETPLPDDDLYFYVPRMFSDLKIAEGWFEEDGTGILDFPEGVIGDTLGVVKVIARIEEHYDYGFVEKMHVTDWAVPKHPILQEGPSRELWTPVAPLWMIITLIVMLTGVWGHYFYAVYRLYKIKKAGK